MNVIMLLTNPCNPDLRVMKEAAYIIKRGHNVTILCWDRDKDTELPKVSWYAGAKIIRFRIPSVYGTGYKQLGAFFRFAKACKAYIKKETVDVVHCHDLDGYVVYRSLCMNHIPYIWDMHENYIKGNGIVQRIIRQIVIYGVKKSRKSICVSRDVIYKMPERIRNQMILLRNYPDASYLEWRPKTESSYLRIGYHGMVRKQMKEFKALFEACKRMEAVKIDINGGGTDLKELQDLAKAYDNVTIHGPYNGLTDSNRLYENTDILFCGYDPTITNYQGDTEVVKYYEAIITGTPMIMTKGIGMGEKVEKMDIGAAVDTRNQEELKDVIQELLVNRSQLERWRNNMQQIADRYQWSSAVVILNEIY